MLRHIEGYSNSLKDILAYSGILMHIQPHSHGATRGRMKASPVLVENWKMCLDFRKKYSDYVHLWVKSELKLNLREKKLSLRDLFFLYFWRNVYRRFLVPLSNPSILPAPLLHSLALKNVWFHTCTQLVLFLQNAPS